MSEQSPVADWDREPRHGHAPGGFGFIEMGDEPAVDVIIVDLPKQVGQDRLEEVRDLGTHPYLYPIPLSAYVDRNRLSEQPQEAQQGEQL